MVDLLSIDEWYLTRNEYSGFSVAMTNISLFLEINFTF